MRKLTPERIAVILNDVKSDLSRSIGELAKVHKINHGTLCKLLKDNDIETHSQRDARLRHEKPYLNQPAIDIRGIYLSSDISIIVLALRNLDIKKSEIEEILMSQGEELLPITYLSAGQLNSAKLSDLIEMRSEGSDEVIQKNAHLTPEGWFSKIQVASLKSSVKSRYQGNTEKLVALVGYKREEDIPALDHQALLEQINLCADEYPLSAAIARMMTAPNIAPLEASAFPSLAVALVMLENNNSCMLSPEHTTEAITIRLQCATAINSVGMKVAGAHQMPRSAETRGGIFRLPLLKKRQREFLLKCNKESMSPFLPIKIKDLGGRFIDWKEGANSNNYIFCSEQFRVLMLESESLEFIQERWIKAQNAQKIFLEQNNNHPLIDCARLLGPEVSWLGSKEALNSMLLHVGGDPLIKPALLSSLFLNLIDSSVFVKALEQKKETCGILEDMRADYMKFLALHVFPSALREIEKIKNRYKVDRLDSENIIAQLQADFLVEECKLLLQRALELVTSAIQYQLSSMLTDPIIKDQVEIGKEILLRSASLSEKEKQKFSDNVSQILESKKASICASFLLPWPTVSFDLKLIKYRYKWHLKAFRDEMKKVISLKEAPLDTIGVDCDKDDSFKPHIPAIEDEKLSAVSGSGKMNLEAIFSAKTPEVFHTKLLDLEKSVAADPRIPAKLISLAKETKAELPLLKLILDYFETLKLGNMSLIDSARKAFEEAIFPEGDLGS